MNTATSKFVSDKRKPSKAEQFAIQMRAAVEKALPAIIKSLAEVYDSGVKLLKETPTLPKNVSSSQIPEIQKVLLEISEIREKVGSICIEYKNEVTFIRKMDKQKNLPVEIATISSEEINALLDQDRIELVLNTTQEFSELLKEFSKKGYTQKKLDTLILVQQRESQWYTQICDEGILKYLHPNSTEHTHRIGTGGYINAEDVTMQDIPLGQLVERIERFFNGISLEGMESLEATSSNNFSETETNTEVVISIPAYQRPYLGDIRGIPPDRFTGIIKSMINPCNLMKGNIVLVTNQDKKEYSLVDGQQRLTTLYKFVKGQTPIEVVDEKGNVSLLYFHLLPAEEQDKILQITYPAKVIIFSCSDEASEEDRRAMQIQFESELYVRINNTSIPLTESLILRAKCPPIVIAIISKVLNNVKAYSASIYDKFFVTSSDVTKNCGGDILMVLKALNYTFQESPCSITWKSYDYYDSIPKSMYHSLRAKPEEVKKVFEVLPSVVSFLLGKGIQVSTFYKRNKKTPEFNLNYLEAALFAILRIILKDKDDILYNLFIGGNESDLDLFLEMYSDITNGVKIISLEEALQKCCTAGTTDTKNICYSEVDPMSDSEVLKYSGRLPAFAKKILAVRNLIYSESQMDFRQLEL